MKPKTINNLLAACARFEKLAAWDLAKVVTTFKPQLAAEVAAGIRSLNYLVSHNKECASAESFQVLDDVFGKIGEVVNELNPTQTSGLDMSLKNIFQYYGGGLFYTSSYNAGVGFDPKTRLGGNDSPAVHLNNINTLAKKMEGYVKYNNVIAPHDKPE